MKHAKKQQNYTASLPKKTTSNQLTWGLFQYRGKYWLNNIRDVKTFIKRVIFTLKHGYAPQAQWETFTWFIDTMQEILTWYADNRCGTPARYSHHDEYTQVLQHYIKLLQQMKYDGWDSGECLKAQHCAQEFFKWFADNFYDFWD